MGVVQPVLAAPPALGIGMDPEALSSGFRLAMRRLAATVSLIATRHDGIPVGMAATSVSSLAANPPSLLLSVSHGASLHQPLLAVGRFSVNVLRVAQRPLIPVFSGKLKGPERFEHGNWQDEDGLPFLADAQAVMLCRVAGTMTHADSEVVIGVIEAVRVRDEIAPLVWQDGPAAETRLLK
jgi:flavin reductase (DIM6/NTAB) family NADH-FMN oxidoreductase RutF